MFLTVPARSPGAPPVSNWRMLPREVVRWIVTVPPPSIVTAPKEWGELFRPRAVWVTVAGLSLTGMVPRPVRLAFGVLRPGRKEPAPPIAHDPLPLVGSAEL